MALSATLGRAFGRIARALVASPAIAPRYSSESTVDSRAAALHGGTDAEPRWLCRRWSAKGARRTLTAPCGRGPCCAVRGECDDRPEGPEANHPRPPSEDRRILSLNPNDNRGVRFCRQQIRRGLSGTRRRRGSSAGWSAVVGWRRPRRCTVCRGRRRRAPAALRTARSPRFGQPAHAAPRSGAEGGSSPR